MIQLDFNPRRNESKLNLDLNWAFENSSDFSEFINNAGIEAQTAILAIISQMYNTIIHVTGGGMTEDHKRIVKEVLIKIACGDVNVSKLDLFRKITAQEGTVPS